MDCDSKTLSEYKNNEEIARYLSTKYKKTVLTINIGNTLEIINELTYDSMIELIENISEDVFKGDIFLKIFTVTSCGPIFFLVINESYEIVKVLADKIMNKYFMKCNIFVNVFKYA